MRAFLIHIIYILLAAMSIEAFAGGSVVPVGEYLYADESKLPDKPGALEITFTTANANRMVIAYGRKFRKDRADRRGTDEDGRQAFKPRLAKLSDGGKKATFVKLPPDYYDIVVIDDRAMTIHEGISLWSADEEPHLGDDAAKPFVDEIRKSLGLRDDRIGGWEGFFDTKNIERIEVADSNAGVFMQQLRKGVALAESGEQLKGCIHSIDVVWVTRSLDDGKSGWQVINRQQLYRNEIVSKEFFAHRHVKALCGIRVGQRKKVVENIELP
ncbi:MAG: hypothetical protein J5833_00490 [Victivallales bacterium]|nr:hypothetical protein [Victivallales bacterium]